MQRREQLARRSLWANAAFSTAAGLVLLLDAGPLAVATGLPNTLGLQVVGAGLLPFALFVGLTARSPKLDTKRVTAISIMDAGWVLGTIGLALAWPALFNPTGWVAAALVAVFVDVCLVGQLMGLRRLRGPKSAAPATRPAGA